MRFLSPAALFYLEKTVDWDKDYLFTDLYRIAYSMHRWDTFAFRLRLNHMEVADIKHAHHSHKEQRLAYLSIMLVNKLTMA